MQGLTQEKRAAAEELVASRLRAHGIKVRGKVEIVGMRTHAGHLTISYWYEGKLWHWHQAGWKASC